MRASLFAYCFVVILTVVPAAYATTSIVKDIAFSGPNQSSSPQSIAAAGRYAYFSADDGIHGAELWKTDGADAGTVLVKDVLPGRYGSNPTNITVADKLVYFVARDLDGHPQLWRSDGSDAGTWLLRKDMTVCE
ncbi:MAG TPA: ELWxxDGT repeat protein, partial [Acidobacteriota bacterium]|nr:ELWxxDGT repeat protein [Acidobacteriota bacterium]